MKATIVISAFNEELGILHFWENLKTFLIESNKGNQFELFWVNDGSIDKTQSIIDSIIQDELPFIKHKSILFSKNFGHEAAMLAGIDNATGEVVICMDSDGQHPPDKINEMINLYLSGKDIVLMQRVIRGDKGFINKLSKIFYLSINLISDIKFQENSSDFFLISLPIVQVLKEHFRDQSRFLRGFIQSLGFNVGTIEFNAPSREFGNSHYSFFSLIKLSVNAIFSFSNKPLRISIFFTFVFIITTLIFIIYSLFNYFKISEIPSGYTSIVIFMSLSFSLLFFSIAIISLYFEKLIKETKGRPLYIIKQLK